MSEKTEFKQQANPRLHELLQKAHDCGLKSVTTKIIKVPTTFDPKIIVITRITTANGYFEGIGDASPDNVDKEIAPHYIRMAETRALERAIRWATNTSVTAADEFSRRQQPLSVGQEKYIRDLSKSKDISPELREQILKHWDKCPAPGCCTTF